MREPGELLLGVGCLSAKQVGWLSGSFREKWDGNLTMSSWSILLPGQETNGAGGEEQGGGWRMSIETLFKV